MRQKVVVVSTGGTIAMKFDPLLGVVPAVSGQDLVDAVPELGEVCEVEVREFANIPSPHMTPSIMLTLARQVEKALDEDGVLGVVVTHGTDTLEETAYFLDLYVEHAKPVCLTAAMRSAGELSPDGPKNILCAVRAAASPKTRNMGTLVVLNETIQAAREVSKTHSANPATFDSPFWGPLGYVDEDMLLMRRAPVGREHIHPEALNGEVALVKVVTGDDASLLDYYLGRGVAGLVLEGFGRGNVPPAVVPGIERAVAQSVPVVLVSRTAGGRVLDVYGYPGGVKTVLAAGAVSGGELSASKARIKLLLALGVTHDPQKIAAYFSEA